MRRLSELYGGVEGIGLESGETQVSIEAWHRVTPMLTVDKARALAADLLRAADAAEAFARDLRRYPVLGALPVPSECPKCHADSGDDWRQCKGACPMPMSPHYTAAVRAAEEAGDTDEARALLAEQLNDKRKACGV